MLFVMLVVKGRGEGGHLTGGIGGGGADEVTMAMIIMMIMVNAREEKHT